MKSSITMDTSFKYDDSKLTLADIVGQRGIPEVVRVCADDHGKDKIGYRYHSRIGKETELYLQSIQKVKYAHIKVLPFYDNSKAQKEKGPEYVLEHETFVGEEFLIPVKYREKVKFVHRPGSWRRFGTISQMIEATPRFVKVGENTNALNAKELQETLTIPAGTTLELIREFQNPIDGVTYIECKDDNACYAFKPDDVVNFTEVDDTKQYILIELLRFKMLPKVIMFQNVSLQDAILVDKEYDSGMMTSLEGPVELLGFVVVEHLVTWVRDKDKKVYRVVLIPKGSWNTILVQKRYFLNEADKNAYIKRKFRLCESSDFIHKCMYWMPLDQTQVAWLRNPEFCAASTNENRLYDTLDIDFPVSSDDEAGAYEDIPEEDKDYGKPPPIPKREKLRTEPQKRRTWSGDESVWKKIQRKKKQFKTVHKELLNFFHKKIQQHDDYEKDRPPARPPKPPSIQRSFSDRRAHPTNVGASKGRKFKRSGSVDDSRLPECSEEGEENSEDTDSHTYDYPDLIKMTNFFEPIVEGKNKGRPLPPKPTDEAKDSHFMKAESASVSKEETEHSLGQGQTENEFFKYSVAEVENCFRSYGLPDFASKCLEQKLDGVFFKHLDLQVLTTIPFNLSKFQVQKVKKLIYDGWRPKVREENVGSNEIIYL